MSEELPTLHYEQVVYDYEDGSRIYNEELIVAELLMRGEMHLNNTESDGQRTVCAFVVCSDIFAWACADSEPVTCKELPALYEMYAKDPKWGTAKWCILKRNQLPQPPVLRDMKKDGLWDLDESAIGPNTMDAETQALFAYAAANLAKKGEV